MKDKINGFKALRVLGIVCLVFIVMIFFENLKTYTTLNFILLGLWASLALLITIASHLIIKKYKDTPQKK